jgi:predicted RNA-binding Zn ribbon-like protein
LAPPRYDVPNAAPGRLRLVQELVNTCDDEHGREWLATTAELRAWLRARSLVGARTPVRDPELRRALELREALRELMIANNVGTTSAGGLAVLNEVAARTRLAVRFDEAGAALVPRSHGVERALGEIVAIVADALRDGSWRRLKACRNCHWAFYDESRNRSGTWCSMLLCGNRLKTRAYRRRATPRRARTAG